jgi:hypothetical protein
MGAWAEMDARGWNHSGMGVAARRMHAEMQPYRIMRYRHTKWTGGYIDWFSTCCAEIFMVVL